MKLKRFEEKEKGSRNEKKGGRRKKRKKKNPKVRVKVKKNPKKMIKKIKRIKMMKKKKVKFNLMKKKRKTKNPPAEIIGKNRGPDPVTAKRNLEGVDRGQENGPIEVPTNKVTFLLKMCSVTES